MMFINSIFEFCIGYLCNYDVLLIDSSLSLLVLGSILYNEFGIGDLGEFLSNDRGDVRGYEIQSSINSVIGSVLVDNICSGLVSDGICSLVYIGVSLICGIISVFSNYSSYLISGFDSCGIIVGGNDSMSLLLISFEGIGFIMRSLSMGIRVFSNLVSGVLLSSIFMPLSVIGLVGSLSCSSIILGVISCSLLLISVIGLIGLESFVGVVQNFVFLVLGDNYSVDVRGSNSCSSRGSNRYILSLLLPLICVGESSNINGYLGIVLLLCSLGVGIYCGRGLVNGICNYIDQSQSSSYNLVEEIISRNPGLRNIPIEESSIYDGIDSIISSPYFIIGLGIVVVVGGLIMSGVLYNVSVGNNSGQISLVENDSVQNVGYNCIGCVYNCYRNVVDSIVSSFSSLYSPEFISYCSIVGVYGLFIGMSLYFMFRGDRFISGSQLESLINGDSNIIGCGCDLQRLSRIGREFFRGCSYISYSSFGSRVDVFIEILRLVGPYLPQLGNIINLELYMLSQGRINLGDSFNEVLRRVFRRIIREVGEQRIQNDGLIGDYENNLIIGSYQVMRRLNLYRPDISYGSYYSYLDMFSLQNSGRLQYILNGRGFYLRNDLLSQLPLFQNELNGVSNYNCLSVEMYYDLCNQLLSGEQLSENVLRVLRQNGYVVRNGVIGQYFSFNQEFRSLDPLVVLQRLSEDLIVQMRRDEEGYLRPVLQSIGNRSYSQIYNDLNIFMDRRYNRGLYRDIVLQSRFNSRYDYIRYICEVDNNNLILGSGVNSYSEEMILNSLNYGFYSSIQCVGEIFGGVCTVKPSRCGENILKT